MTNNLAQILEHSAAFFPEKDAFNCLDDSLSYSDLNIKANQLAQHLILKGLRKGDRVGIYMNRCLDTAIAVYGILKAGGAFVAINTFMPLSRTMTIMKDCGIEHLITTPKQSRKIDGISKAAPFLKTIIGVSIEQESKAISWDAIFSISLDRYSQPVLLEQDLASILYTSGSTGVPKGIMHTHASLVSLAKLEVKLHDASDKDIIGNFAPLHFDQSLFGLFAGPLVGAKTVIFPDSHVRLPASLAKLVAKEKITLWFSVPLILTQMLLHGKIENYNFSALRCVRFGGEVFPVKQLRELMQKWPHAKFINSYGPSELARCTYYIIEEPPKTNDPIPIGTVWGNTEYLILDEKDKKVKKGEAGELVVRTATLMAGYWNNPELTEASLYRLPITSGFEYVFYRTGDLFYENENNELMFLGRIDRQIKLRGYRIELDEIESVLLKNESIEEAAVLVIEKNGHKEIEGMVRPVNGCELSPKDLMRFCKNMLPAYSVPEKITVMQDFPRTGTGKIDRPKIKEMLETKDI